MVRLDAPTAVTMVLSGQQDRAFVSVYGATAAFTEEDLNRNILAKARHLHVSGLWQSDALRPALIPLFQKMRERNVTVSLDTGYDASDRWGDPLPELLSHIDVLFPNETEALRISGESTLDAALVWLASRVPVVALKLGGDGGRTRQGEQEWAHPAFKVKVVDTTGAGDAFNAGFLHGWLHGWPMEETLRFANAMGALAVVRIGASEDAPSLETVRQFIAQHAAA
jgi:sugar/nucleoside kinase (ribokinase family)